MFVCGTGNLGAHLGTHPFFPGYHFPMAILAWKALVIGMESKQILTTPIVYDLVS